MEKQCLLKATRSLRVSTYKRIVGFWSPRQTLRLVSPSLFLLAKQRASRENPAGFPLVHTHTCTHTLNATILQFPELLNHVIMSLSLPALSSYCTTCYRSHLPTQGRPSYSLCAKTTLFRSYPPAPTLLNCTLAPNADAGNSQEDRSRWKDKRFVQK